MRIALFIGLIFGSVGLYGSENDSVTTTVNYGKKGWKFQHGENYQMNLQFRLQTRFVAISSDSTFFINEEDNAKNSINIQRARVKVGGNAFSPYLKYYMEYDFPSNNLLNFEFTLARFSWLQLKVGQWKVDYNTERFISSGKQQLVDRSIANRYFTLDRQIGVLLKGNIFENKLASSNYNIGVFNGSGIGSENENGSFMLFARYQWNFSKTIAKTFFSDLERLKKPEGFLALSYIQNVSGYTNFSSSGGGQLPGYSEGTRSQYDIYQLGLEMFFKYKGFSFTSENHLKNVNDVGLNQESTLYGGYLMSGYFLSGLSGFFPENLEIVGRFALVQNSMIFQESIKEYSAGVNWFFNQHRNKLTLDYAYIENNDFNVDNDTHRFRVQWDISF